MLSTDKAIHRTKLSSAKLFATYDTSSLLSGIVLSDKVFSSLLNRVGFVGPWVRWSFYLVGPWVRGSNFFLHEGSWVEIARGFVGLIFCHVGSWVGSWVLFFLVGFIFNFFKAT